MSDKLHLEIKDGYDTLAETYDSLTLAIKLDESVEDQYLPDVRDKSVLELGCGTGRKLVKLLEMGARSVTGVDFSSKMLAVAHRKLGTAARLVEHDINTRLPFEPATFDLVLFSLVTEHIVNLTDLFRETSRVLVKTGKMVIATLHPRFLDNGGRIEFRVQETGLEFWVDSYQKSANEICSCAEAASFNSDGFTEWGSPGLLTATFDKRN